ncbi:calcineurin, partial [Pseudomonas citronellolis]|uniref:calcineurin n=1 Tax=Pseudomonas citronellolis TaxID=53408 RepID=UPI0023E445A4
MKRFLFLAGCILSLCACGAGPGERRHIARDQAFLREHPLPPLALQPRADTFVLPVLPDTQYYAENNRQQRSLLQRSQRYPGLSYDPAMAFFAQTHWLAQNATALQVPLVVHLGDVVQNASNLGQWRVASSAMRLLEEGGVPYAIMTGERDIQGDVPADEERSLRDHFADYFGPQRATWQSTYAGSDPLGLSQYHRFRVGQQEFLLLALDCSPSDATLAWAQQVLDKHPHTPVILASHGIRPPAAGGGRLWDRLIRGNDQIFLTLSSQLEGSSHQRLSNDHGLSVDMLRFDYQAQYLGGNGLLRLLEFDLGHNRLEALTLSPWVLWKRRYLGKTMRQCHDPAALADCDQLAPGASEGWDNRYVLELDFRQRFAAFGGAGLSAAQADAGPGLLGQLKRQL